MLLCCPLLALFVLQYRNQIECLLVDESDHLLDCFTDEGAKLVADGAGEGSDDLVEGVVGRESGLPGRRASAVSPGGGD